MWGDVRRRTVASGAAIAAIAFSSVVCADPTQVAQAPPRDGLAAKPAPSGAPGIKPKPLPKAGAPGGSGPPAAPGVAQPAIPPGSGAQPAAAASPSVVTVRGDRLTVQVTDVPLDDVLRRIAEPSKADVRGSLTTPRNVTADFADVPLQDGLARLLGEQNFLLTYRIDGGLKRLTLMGGSVVDQVGTHVVKAGAPAPAPQSQGDLLQRRVPVRGKLKDYLKEETATLQQLMDIALRQDDAGLRIEAMTVGLNAMDTQPDLRASVVQSLAAGGDQAFEGVLRTVPPDRAMEILTRVTGSRIPELRARGLEMVRRLNEPPEEPVEP